jgi:hypothetical protein
MILEFGQWMEKSYRQLIFHLLKNFITYLGIIFIRLAKKLAYKISLSLALDEHTLIHYLRGQRRIFLEGEIEEDFSLIDIIKIILASEDK